MRTVCKNISFAATFANVPTFASLPPHQQIMWSSAALEALPAKILSVSSLELRFLTALKLMRYDGGTFLPTAAGGDAWCPICLADGSLAERRVTVYACGHTACLGCARSYEKFSMPRTTACPVCRQCGSNEIHSLGLSLEKSIAGMRRCRRVNLEVGCNGGFSISILDQILEKFGSTTDDKECQDIDERRKLLWTKAIEEIATYGPPIIGSRRAFLADWVCEQKSVRAAMTSLLHASAEQLSGIKNTDSEESDSSDSTSSDTRAEQSAPHPPTRSLLVEPRARRRCRRTLDFAPHCVAPLMCDVALWGVLSIGIIPASTCHPVVTATCLLASMPYCGLRLLCCGACCARMAESCASRDLTPSTEAMESEICVRLRHCGCARMAVVLSPADLETAVSKCAGASLRLNAESEQLLAQIGGEKWREKPENRGVLNLVEDIKWLAEKSANQ